MRTQKGFTLIELMIVIAILGILMAIAIPAYGDYSIRARVGEGINMASGAKLAVGEYYLSEGAYPTTTVAAGLDPTISTSFLASLSVGASGVITITTQNTGALAGQDPVLNLTPTTATGGINWSCSTTTGTQYVPSSCR